MATSKPPCHDCTAVCCKQGENHDFAVLLTPQERLRFKDVAQQFDQGWGGKSIMTWALPNKDGQCVLLGADNKCTVYEKRPRLCREFSCTTMRDNGQPAFFHEDNPGILVLLLKHGLLSKKLAEQVRLREASGERRNEE